MTKTRRDQSRRWPALLAVALLAIALAGCDDSFLGSAAPAPTRSPRPTSSDGTSASGGASPTSPALAAQVVIDGLRAFAADPDRTYVATFQGDSRHSSDILAVKGTLTVSGEDASITATFKFPRQGTSRTEYRRVAGADWVRFDKKNWRQLGGPEPAAVVDPFSGLGDGTAVQYLGTVEGKPDRHRVQLTGMVLHPALIPAGNLTDEAITSTKLVLVTDPAGLPVSGTWSMRGRGRVSGQLQAVVIELDLTFSKIGQPVTITAP